MRTPRPFNVLVTSLSRKVALVREVRKALDKFSPGSLVFGADCDADCVGSYFVDSFWQMPTLEELHTDELLEFCTKNGIQAIIPTRDSELEYYASEKKVIRRHGIAVMLPSFATVRFCNDKLRFYYHVKNHPGIIPIHTAVKPDPVMTTRWVVKERFGSGARGLLMDVSLEKARFAVSSFQSPVFQPYIEGQEYSIDMYCCRTGQPLGIVVRSRDRVNQGESQITTIVDRTDIEKICIEAARMLNLTYHAVFQVIVDSEGKIYLNECNCRFGGASSLSLAAGLDSFYWFFLESVDEKLLHQPLVRSEVKLKQVRYPEDMLVSMDEGIGEIKKTFSGQLTCFGEKAKAPLRSL